MLDSAGKPIPDLEKRRTGLEWAVDWARRMAEARKLVTHGPYRLVRHPLYLAEEVATIGIFLQFLSWPAAAVLALHFGFQIARMLNEERVLGEAFPEYADYARRTARLMPGVW